MILLTLMRWQQLKYRKAWDGKIRLWVYAYLLELWLVYLFKQAAISLKTAQHEAKLTEMYMVGAHPSWPDKHVWVDPGHPDHVWELIPIRLRVWASSIIRTNNHSTQLVANVGCDIQATGETNYTRPPTSNHFNDDKRLCEPQCPVLRFHTMPTIFGQTPLFLTLTPDITMTSLWHHPHLWHHH